MSGQSLKSKVAKGAAWTLLEKLSVQLVGFVVSMVLARLLTPDDYGTVALTTIFFAIAGVLVDGGFGGALVQKKDADDIDFNSVFYLNLFMSVVAYIALYFAAPSISSFYKVPELTAIVRISAICLFFNAVNAVQNAELIKKMLFHLSFRVSLITCLTSAIFGVSLAYLGFGVWALVYSSLMAGLSGVLARWYIIAWRPKLMFSVARLKPLFSYGWKMSVSSLLDQTFNNLNGILMGKFYTKADVAYVKLGYHLPQSGMGLIDSTVGQVSFPALVLMQDDKIKLRDAMRRLIQSSTFLVFPLMVGLAVCARTIIRFIYGSQWMPAAPYMVLACFSFALWPFHTINLRGIQALGRSDVFLKLEIIKKLLALVVILSSFRLGVFVWMAISALVLGPLGFIINSWPNRRLLDYTIGMQIRDVMPTVLVCIVEAFAVLGVGIVIDILKPMLCVADEGARLAVFLGCELLFQFLVGTIMFFTLAYFFRLKPMYEYSHIAAGIVRSRWPKFAAALERRFTT